MRSSKTLPYTTAMDPNAGSSSIPAASEPSLEADHWRNGSEDLFVNWELSRREENRAASRGPEPHGKLSNDLFISHSLRNPATQEIKRRFIAELSRTRVEKGQLVRGFTYWSDFLDLASCGPVAWRREIEVGISSAAKFVAFIDEDFLLSYNCIMEVKSAMVSRKPIVPIILDNKAWDLLTSPSGADLAWGKNARLAEYEGQQFLAGSVFSKATMKEVFDYLSNINFCACRPDDIKYWGEEPTIKNMLLDVNKDIPYLKEWTELESLASKWSRRGSRKQDLLSGEDIQSWKSWCSQATRYSMEPAPTELQHAFVSASSTNRYRRKQFLAATGLVVVFLILAGAVGAIILGIKARQNEAEAVKQAERAEYALDLATASLDLARENEKEALEQRRVADMQMRISDTLLLGSNMNPTSSRDLRALLKACEVALFVDKYEIIMAHLNTVLKRMTTQKYWFYELEGHSDWSRAVQFSPRGDYLATGSNDGTVRIWPLTSSRLSLLPEVVPPVVMVCSEDKSVYSLSWNPAGDMLAAGVDMSRAVCIWRRSEEGNEWLLHRLLTDEQQAEREGTVRAVQFSPDGRFLAWSLSDGVAYLWDMLENTNTMIRARQETDVRHDIRAFAWLPGGTQLLYGDINNTVTLWDKESGKVLATTASFGDVNSLAVRELYDGTPQLAVAMDGGLIETLNVVASTGLDDPWRLEHVQYLPRPPDAILIDTDETIRGVAWSPNKTHLAVASSTNGTTIYGERSGGGELELRVLSTFNGRHQSLDWKERVVDLPGGGGQVPVQTIAASTSGLQIEMWQEAIDFGDGGPELHQLGCDMADIAGHSHTVRSVAFSANGDRVASGAYTGTVCIWERNLKTKEFENVGLLLADTGNGREAKRAIDWSPDGSLLAVGSDSNLTVVIDTSGRDAKVLHILGNHSSMVRAVCWSPDSRYLATGALSPDPSIMVWDVRGDSPTHGALQLIGHTSHVRAMSWRLVSAGTLQLASASSDETVRIWTLRIVADGRLVNDHVQVLAMEAQVWSVGFSLNGVLAAGTNDGTIKLWALNANGFTEVLTLKGHTGTVLDLVWSPEGDMLVTLSRDVTLRHWELDTANYKLLRTWKINTDGSFMSWISGGPNAAGRVGVTRNPSESEVLNGKETFATEIEFFVVGFHQQYKLLRQMTYGKLSTSDLEVLGYQHLEHLL